MSLERKRILIVVAVIVAVLAIILIASLSGSGEMAGGYQDAVRQRQGVRH